MSDFNKVMKVLNFVQSSELNNVDLDFLSDNMSRNSAFSDFIATGISLRMVKEKWENYILKIEWEPWLSKDKKLCSCLILNKKIAWIIYSLNIN